jgi:hypothetical protein
MTLIDHSPLVGMLEMLEATWFFVTYVTGAPIDWIPVLIGAGTVTDTKDIGRPSWIVVESEKGLLLAEMSLQIRRYQISRMLSTPLCAMLTSPSICIGLPWQLIELISLQVL